MMNIDEHCEDFAAQFLDTVQQNVDLSFRPKQVLPGENITALVTSFKQNVRIGAGIQQEDDQFIACTCGSLKYRPPSSYWIESDSKRYSPMTGDQVVGIIEEKLSEYYRVNIFSGTTAMLGRLSFEGATKRNKPELKRGDLIYARVALAHKDLETELTCVSSSGSKKEWSSGESVYGDLAEGLMIRVSILTARKLLLPDNIVLNSLGRHLAFEVAIGMNGIVWVRAGSVRDTIVIRNALLNSQLLGDLQAEAMVEKLIALSKR